MKKITITLEVTLEELQKIIRVFEPSPQARWNKRARAKQDATDSQPTTKPKSATSRKSSVKSQPPQAESEAGGSKAGGIWSIDYVDKTGKRRNAEGPDLEELRERLKWYETGEERFFEDEAARTEWAIEHYKDYDM